MGQEESKYKQDEFVTFVKDTSELRTWTMYVNEFNLRAYDYYVFTKTEKENFVGITEKEVQRLKSAKVSFMFSIRFKKDIENDGKFDIMDRYFDDKENQPRLFLNPDKEKIEKKYNKFVENTANDIEDVEMEGSGWKFERVMRAYIKVEIYRPIRGGSYLPLPAWLANKKAIINVKNKDNQCLKWAIRAALFPAPKGKNPNRTSSYPEKDGVNYEGIEFPTPLHQIKKLEKQNKDLAITVFGYENGRVFPLRVSKRNGPKEVNPILIESGGVQHYCHVKRVSALLRDRIKNRKEYHCSCA